MNMGRAKELLRELLALDPAEQDEVIEAFWTSRTAGELSPEWEAEIDRRVADVDSGRIKTIPGEEVFARLEKRFGGK